MSCFKSETAPPHFSPLQAAKTECLYAHRGVEKGTAAHAKGLWKSSVRTAVIFAWVILTTHFVVNGVIKKKGNWFSSQIFLNFGNIKRGGLRFSEPRTICRVKSISNEGYKRNGSPVADLLNFSKGIWFPKRSLFWITFTSGFFLFFVLVRDSCVNSLVLNLSWCVCCSAFPCSDGSVPFSDSGTHPAAPKDEDQAGPRRPECYFPMWAENHSQKGESLVSYSHLDFWTLRWMQERKLYCKG